jgi:hypothetical protein
MSCLTRTKSTILLLKMIYYFTNQTTHQAHMTASWTCLSALGWRLMCRDFLFLSIVMFAPKFGFTLMLIIGANRKWGYVKWMGQQGRICDRKRRRMAEWKTTIAPRKTLPNIFYNNCYRVLEEVDLKKMDGLWKRWHENKKSEHWDDEWYKRMEEENMLCWPHLVG